MSKTVWYPDGPEQVVGDFEMGMVERFRRRVLREFVARLAGRLRGRMEMNERTSGLHPDPDVRLEARDRAEGIALAIMDLDYVAREFGVDPEG